MDSGKVVLGVLAGAAIGALLGVLLAPDKGSETRKKICTKCGGFTDDIKDKFNELFNGMNEKFETVKEDLENKKSGMGSKEKDMHTATS